MTIAFSTLRIGFREIPVSDMAEASKLYRAAIGDRGASKMPEGVLLDDAGNITGRISYNGRVWAGNVWKPADLPLYCPSAEGR